MFIHIDEISFNNTQYTVSFINFSDPWMWGYCQFELCRNQPWILLSQEDITDLHFSIFNLRSYSSDQFFIDSLLTTILYGV